MKISYFNTAGLLRFVLVIILLIYASDAFPQKVITLKQCYDGALGSTALAGDKDLYSQISGLKQKNIEKGWMPTVDLNGSALYNSSVIDLRSALGSLPFPGIADALKPLPHDQYKLTLDINQVIYDGGAIKGAKDLEKADLKVNEMQTKTDLYKTRAQVNSLYFNLLLIDRQKELLDTYLETLEKRVASLRSATENGVALRSDMDIIESEKIRIGQQISENEVRKISLVKVLSDLTGLEIDTAAKLVPPAEKADLSDEILRPELQFFDLRKEQLDAGLALTQSKRLPKAFGFASFGYGNPPGNNFFKDQFDTYYILGAGIKWNIFDWNRTKNEKQVISLQKNLIDSRKKDLADNLRRQLDTKQAEITNLHKLIESDEELIRLRKRITAAAESQYQNGTITATEYLNILNSEKQAEINSGIHKINLSLAEVEYQNITGQEIE